MPAYFGPKVQVICNECGWRGQRAKHRAGKRCPSCDHWRPVRATWICTNCSPLDSVLCGERCKHCGQAEDGR